MPPSPPRRAPPPAALLVPAVAASVAGSLLALRWVLLGLLVIFQQVVVRHQGLAPPASFVLALVAGGVLGTTAVRGLALLPRPAAALAILLGLGAVAPPWVASYRAHQTGVFLWFTDGTRRLGSFPHPGGAVLEEDRGAWHQIAHVLPDGSRACGSGEEGPVVAYVGDSFVFGTGLEDPGTLCWQVRERLDAAGATGWRHVNLGQPGAAIRSVVETARFALEDHGARVLLVGVLVGDDARVVDVNTYGALVRSPLFQVVAAALDPERLVEFAAVIYEILPPDLLPHAAVRTGFEDLARLAEAHDARVALHLQPPPTGRWILATYEAEAEAVAARWPGRFAFVPVDLDDGPPDAPHRIPGDGHTTAEGNAVLADQLAPALRPLLAEVTP